jgi:RNA polymerase sigma factor (sigma-70 family)
MEPNSTKDNSDDKKNAKQIGFDEYALWKDFKNGDVNAYGLIYRKYFFVLFSYGKKINPDHELIKDCIQELFIKIWNNRENLSETTAIKYYLFTALKRKLLDVHRKAQLDLVNKEPQEYTEQSDTQEFEDYQEDQSSSIEKERVTRALSKLSKHQQKILDMKFQRNLTNKEIADEMGITIQSVYNAVFKALRSIRKHISGMAMIQAIFFAGTI